MKLEKLWYGDHFSLPGSPDEIFCVFSVQPHRVVAVKRAAAMKLKENGYGYIGAGMASFKRTDDIRFIPVGTIGADE